MSPSEFLKHSWVHHPQTSKLLFVQDNVELLSWEIEGRVGGDEFIVFAEVEVGFFEDEIQSSMHD